MSSDAIEYSTISSIVYVLNAGGFSTVNKQATTHGIATACVSTVMGSYLDGLISL